MMNDAADPFANVLPRGAEAIARRLVEGVVSGRLPAGTPLPTERELCETHGASRPTVREAISRLQLMGYATAEVGRRPRARHPSLEDVLEAARDRVLGVLGEEEGTAHLEQMRVFIETGAVREAIRRATAAEVAKIKIALSQGAEAIATPDFAAADIAFHRAIVAVPGNPVMLTLHDMFVSRFLAARPPVPDAQAHDRMVHAEHAAILDAILAGDEMTATQRMDDHLERSHRARLRGELTTGPTQIGATREETT